MRAADSSVAIAAFASWHEHHRLARAALADEEVRLVAHCAVETYSVLTRMPEPNRADPSAVLEFLRRRFPDPYLVLPTGEYRRLVPRLAELGIAGGAVYDGLVGLSAHTASARLLTLDRRAAPTYARCDAGFDLLAEGSRPG